MCGNHQMMSQPSHSNNHGDNSNTNTNNGSSKIYQAKKFYVGPGNNFPIVKSVLKQRYWWQYGAEESFAADCDFIWTAWKKQKHIDFLSNVVSEKVVSVKANTKQSIKS